MQFMYISTGNCGKHLLIFFPVIASKLIGLGDALAQPSYISQLVSDANTIDTSKILKTKRKLLFGQATCSWQSSLGTLIDASYRVWRTDSVMPHTTVPPLKGTVHRSPIKTLRKSVFFSWKKLFIQFNSVCQTFVIPKHLQFKRLTGEVG